MFATLVGVPPMSEQDLIALLRSTVMLSPRQSVMIQREHLVSICEELLEFRKRARTEK